MIEKYEIKEIDKRVAKLRASKGYDNMDWKKYCYGCGKKLEKGYLCEGCASLLDGEAS